MVVVPTLDHEHQLWQAGYLRVAGVDEAGLGPLVGPVVAAACLIPPQVEMIPGVRDSKTLSASQRERLYGQILQQAHAVGVGAASVREIDTLNVLAASRLAMKRALARIAPYDYVMVDGRDIRNCTFGPCTAIIRGDASSYAIACASILAKVTRDRLMRRLAVRYPGYGWERNSGYGSAEHMTSLRTLGPTPFHRRSFAPVRTLLDPNLFSDLNQHDAMKDHERSPGAAAETAPFPATE